MSYTRARPIGGVGAIAATDPTFSREARRGDPMLNLPRRTRLGAPSEVLPGVVVRSAALVRPAVLMSGVRPGQPPGGGYGRSGMGAINLDERGHSGGSGGGGGGGRAGKGLDADVERRAVLLDDRADADASADLHGRRVDADRRAPPSRKVPGVMTYPAPPSTTVTSVTARSTLDARTLLLLGGGALALYLLTRKRR